MRGRSRALRDSGRNDVKRKGVRRTVLRLLRWRRAPSQVASSTFCPQDTSNAWSQSRGRMVDGGKTSNVNRERRFATGPPPPDRVSTVDRPTDRRSKRKTTLGRRSSFFRKYRSYETWSQRPNDAIQDDNTDDVGGGDNSGSSAWPTRRPPTIEHRTAVRLEKSKIGFLTDAKP